MVYVIGITGRICSGKSTLLNVMNSRGIPTIDCDKIGWELYSKDSIAFSAYVKEFGKDVIGKDGNIDRKKLSACVFGHPEKVKRISEISWPMIYQVLVNKIEKFSCEGHKIVGVEAALLIKANWECINEIWQTKIDDEITINRLMKRNNLSREEASKRLNSQPSQEEYDKKANVTFNTNCSLEQTAKEINKKLDETIKMVEAK
ncbi:Dephospho-CoA kinase, putative [Entamoeba invadens IP1]|uniref:Dephospho-CoA kinase, putative n=1 Tax=Entamoeba invadens IP1 TaxID=370355 RepID=A0A0A1UF93_ENTIV|nr:Dephospho-CoA kinase, putative [Entamoeba invadens IP1]ELP95260.1 Dephospho-CoA kinase, putative [Entamoeba invadens IP1]|eukprot:XP_004262031.1 Dephospho-CoA kinase, putative [Entamoeba invadens IP1]